MPALTIDRLQHAVAEDAAFRRVRRLQPVGGAGDKIFPPTYPAPKKDSPARHVFEHRRIGGENVLCVLVDSVQSQANRLEDALQEAMDAGRLFVPHIAVNFSQTEIADIGRLTGLQVPHRVFDAIIRDSMQGGEEFGASDLGQKVAKAKLLNAAGLLPVAPTALLFGAWNSTGEGGGLGAKFPRCITSEVVGVGVSVDADETPSGQRTGSRIDPLGVTKGIEIWKGDGNSWDVDKTKVKGKAKQVRPSEVNHSNIAPSVVPLGVSVQYLLQTSVLSLTGLRRLAFPVGNLARNRANDAAAQTVLAALGLVALCEQDRQGHFLRSRCELVGDPDAPEHQRGAFEIVAANGTVETVDIDSGTAQTLYDAAVKDLQAAGLPWSDQPIDLTPSSKLVAIVKASRDKALRGEVEAEDGDG